MHHLLQHKNTSALSKPKSEENIEIEANKGKGRIEEHKIVTVIPT